MSWPIVQYVLTAALRDRVILSLVLLIVVGISVSLFLGSAAVTESDSFSLVFAAGGLRLTGVAGLVLFVIFHVRRSFDAKDVEFLLSRPVSRTSFLLSHAFAFSLLAVFLSAAVLAGLWLGVPGRPGPGIILWGASLLAELIIMVNVALFFSMVVSSAAGGALITFAFYILGRLIGQILGIITTGSSLPFFDVMGRLMEIISFIIPRFDLMGQGSWLIYAPDPATDVGFAFILLQALAFTPLVLAAALVDLTRKKF